MSPNSSLASERTEYWSRFYAQPRSFAPTAFAEHVAAEFPAPAFVIEFGCGAGQDSVFFARRGYSVLGLDSSKGAIARCRALQQSEHLNSCHFAEVDAAKPDQLIRALSAEHARQALLVHQSVIVYMRFFLHAVTFHEERMVFETLVRQFPGGFLLAAEFRTDADRRTRKWFSESHYRRYIAPRRLTRTLEQKHRFNILAVDVGRGLSVYGDENPHLCRLLARAPGQEYTAEVQGRRRE